MIDCWDRSGSVVIKCGDGTIQAQQLHVIDKVRHIAEIVFDGCRKLQRKVHTSEVTISDFHHVADFVSTARAVRNILQGL
jgi:hypothetical protein